jgi:lipid intermediate transporter
MLNSEKVYRHLLFNRLGRPDDKLDPSILRLGTLLLLFDVYLTWARVEKSFVPVSKAPSATGLTNAPIVLQYVFFLTSNALATVAHHLSIRLLVQAFMSNTISKAQIDSPESDAVANPKKLTSEPRNHPTCSSTKDSKPTVGPGLASPSAISTALLVSSCTKLFPLLLVIWPESSSDEAMDMGLTPSFASRARSYVGWAVLLNNIEALLILLDCGYVTAAGLALAGATARWTVEGAVLAIAGLEGEGGPVGDIAGIIGRAANMLPRSA